MGKDDGGCFMRIKILSGRNVPGCVPGIIPAANVICGISNQTAHTASIVSNNPIWNHSFEFKRASKKENILFIIRDADQILGSLQIPVKEVKQGSLNTRFVDLLNEQSPCCVSFTLTLEEKSTLTRKRLLQTTRKLKETVMSRFASDPDLLASHNSSGTMSLERNENIQKSSTRGIQRCHSYVNERTRAGMIARHGHQYVNCSKQRTCGELRNKSSELQSNLTEKSASEERNKKLLVLIQGRNLGTSQSDIVSVHVGGVDCTENIQHFSSEKILVRLPRNAQLSPVSVITKSGGVGQQNAKVKVTFESASSSDEIKSLRRTPSRSETEGSHSDTGKSPVTPYKPPRAAPRNRHHRPSAVYSTASSDSGSDGMCVNTRTLPGRSCNLIPPPRQRSSSSSSLKSSVEPETASNDSVEVPVSSTPRSTPDTPKLRRNMSPLLNAGKLSPHPIRRISNLSDLPVRKLEIVAPQPAQDIIAPPGAFSEGSSVYTGSGGNALYDLPKSDLIEEILKLRGTITNLTKAVSDLSVN